MRMRTGAAALLLACLGGTAAAGVRDAGKHGFTIENTVEVPADADAVWQALVDDVDLWWPRDHTWWGAQSRLRIEPRAGGCFCETDGERQARHMQVVFVEPGKLLRMTGGLGPLQGMGVDGVLEFRLVAAGDDATRITLFYRAGGYTPDDLAAIAPVVDRVQALQLEGLAGHLRTGAPASGAER
ncbi:SRPBCC family protein [Marilutibacter chinensis]|uniref:SRPBCC domain-containing protein n=1 Tax=Marilutibacter chinensis TaxID=2912247 RepID=A0ABS9HNT9_9GAMM|nr:SRPBCC family protein [Lysobacter chinensis]MCF7220651.1 SRPBCC domain-containing protein [Lysobacter chinensis]